MTVRQTHEFNHRYAQRYLDQLDNRDVPHERTMLTFSGIPGSGKTTLALKLAHDFRAQYVQHDRIRDMIRRDGFEPEDYSMIPISRLVIDTIMHNDANKFVILDASIDRSWSVFFEHTKEDDITPIIIRLVVSHDTLRQRQLTRDGFVHPRFDEFVAQFENCRRQVEVDIEITEQYEYGDVFDRVRHLAGIKG